MMKMKYIDTTIAALFLAGLVVLFFFWGCHLDLYMTILAGVIILVAGMVRAVQYKRLKELMPEEADRK